jgi:hypothetical protein
VVVAGAAVAAVGEFRRRRQRSARRRREVVHAAGSAEADLAEAVDVVVAGPGRRLAGSAGWRGFDGGAIGLRRGGAMQRTVRPDLVVDAGEGVELGLQVGDGGGG